jgi:hypothetical protein
MAIFYGDNNPKEKSAPETKVNNGDVRGKLRVLYDTFTYADAISPLNDIVVLGGDDLDSARIHDVQLIISGTGPTTTGLLDIGLESDPDAFWNDLSVVGAQSKNLRLSIDNETAAGFLGLSGDKDRVQITTAQAFDDPSTSLKVTLAVYYTEE